MRPVLTRIRWRFGGDKRWELFVSRDPSRVWDHSQNYTIWEHGAGYSTWVDRWFTVERVR